jgi:hypothetical protein
LDRNGDGRKGRRRRAEGGRGRRKIRSLETRWFATIVDGQECSPDERCCAGRPASDGIAHELLAVTPSRTAHESALAVFFLRILHRIGAPEVASESVRNTHFGRKCDSMSAP